MIVLEPQEYLNKFVRAQGRFLGVVRSFEMNTTPSGSQLKLQVIYISPDVEEPEISWNMYAPEDLKILSDEEIREAVQKDIEATHRQYRETWLYRIEEFCEKKIKLP